MTVDLFPNNRSAVIDPTGRYRYILHREWDATRGRVCWIMLNPSTADANVDDPTIRRCIGFTKAWGYGALSVVNLFALRATNPRALLLPAYEVEQAGFAHAVRDTIGPHNDAWIDRAQDEANLVVAAWGNYGSLHGRDQQVIDIVGRQFLQHLGLTKAGQPWHPLYVRADVLPQQWGLA